MSNKKAVTYVKEAVGYREGENSREIQADECERICEASGLEVSARYFDPAGIRLDFDRMMEDATRYPPSFAVIVVWKLRNFSWSLRGDSQLPGEAESQRRKFGFDNGNLAVRKCPWEGRTEMCGRFSIISSVSALAWRFQLDGHQLPLEFLHSYNIAPSQQVLTVRKDGEGRQATLMCWGLIPSWAKDPSIGSRMINARAETVAEKPAFRTAFRRRRCLVLADGFYEWQKVPGSKAKRPMRIVLRTGEPFAFAGLWETWRDPEGHIIPSCTIITTEANGLLAPIHHRMPVMLSSESESIWLGASVGAPGLLDHLLRPYVPEAMDAYEVSPLVNSVANDTPEVVAPVA